MEKKKIFSMEIAFCLLLNITVLIASISSCTPRFWTDDDWGIANYMSGARGEAHATPYIKFINICLSVPLYWLYKIYHEINWFVVVQVLVIFFSFVCMTYIIVCKLNQCTYKYLKMLLPLAFIFTIAPSFYVRIQYSQTAAIGCAAGATLIMYSYKTKGNRINLEKIFGAVLLLISSLFRSYCFPLIMPFILYMILSYIKVSFHEFKLKKFFFKYINFFCFWGVLTGLWILTLFMQISAYSKGYEDYNAFNSARANLLDYQIYPYEDIKTELDKLGVSQNDYKLITSWTVEDSKYITTDLLTDIKELQPKKDLKQNLKSFIENYRMEMSDSLFTYVILLSIICLVLDFRNMRVGVIYLFIMIHIIALYFNIVGRYPTYVKSGVMFGAICLIIYFIDFKKYMYPHRPVKTLFLLTGFILLFLTGNEYYLKNIGNFEYDFSGVKMYDYLNSRNEDDFMIPTFSNGGTPNIRDSYSVFETTKSGTFENLIGLGGWSTGNPQVVEHYKKRGIYSALHQVADRNVYLLTDKAAVKLLQLYLFEHTGTKSSFSLTNVKYNTTIYKISSDLNINYYEDFRLDNVQLTNDDIYDMYKISSNIYVNEVMDNEKYDIYYSIYDKELQTTRYYMLYDSSEVPINLGKGMSKFALIPMEDLISGKQYELNVVIAGKNKVFGNLNEGVLLGID